MKQMSFGGFFNSTLKSATSDNFSLLLNRFSFFSCPEGAAQTSQLALAKLPLLAAASRLRGSRGSAVPELSTCQTLTPRQPGLQAQQTRLPEPAVCLSAPAPPCRNPSPHQSAGC